jgi:hypothetical protein
MPDTTHEHTTHEHTPDEWRWEARRQAYLALSAHMLGATAKDREDAARDVVAAIERSGAMRLPTDGRR